MLEIREIAKSFDGTRILDSVSFTVQDGSVYGLMGSNGAGKTTLLKLIAGIYRQDAGSISADGTHVFENPEKKRALFLMTEEVAYFPQWTLFDMRRFFKGFYPAWNDKTYYGLLEFFRLPEKKKIQSFSKGMQRQAGLIAAFSSNARLLLLDEAFDGLDITSRAAVRSLLRFYKEYFGAAVVVTSHNLAELELFADRAGMLEDGQLVLDRNLDEMRESCFRIATPEPLSECGFALRQIPAQEGFAYLAEQPEAAIRVALEQRNVGYTLSPATLEDYFAGERSGESLDWEKLF